MNVVHICSYFLGTQLYQNLIDALEQNDTKNRVYVPTINGTQASFQIHDYVDVSYCLNKYDRVLFHYKHNKILRDFYSKYNPGKFDIIHAHTLFSNGYIAWQIYEQYNVPYIVAVRNTDINTFFRYMPHLRGMGIEILKKSKRIIFLSEAYKDELLKKYIPIGLHSNILEKSVIIPNGIDEFWLKNRNQAKSLNSKNNINIVAAGAIDKNKNQLTTLSVCKKLILMGYKVDYTVVGRVFDKALYKKLIGNDFVQYIPHQPKEALINIYRNNEVFVMPSIHETFGLVYAEAMSQGLPVIYSRGQGFDRQFVDGEVGYPVDSFDIDEITENIIRIIDDYNNISGRCINSVDKFDWNSIAVRYIKVYSEVIEEKISQMS